MRERWRRLFSAIPLTASVLRWCCVAAADWYAPLRLCVMRTLRHWCTQVRCIHGHNGVVFVRFTLAWLPVQHLV